jgi:hypothetical protein
MGKGIELAKSLDPEIAEAMEDLRDQLLIVFLKRLGGVADVSVEEMDATGGVAMTLELTENPKGFRFEIIKKQ